MTTYKREISIGREKARTILAELGRADEYDPAGDYYIALTADGDECLTAWGQDEPLATNHTSTSWM